MGIGRPVGPGDPADFVLKPFTSTEKKDVEDLVARGAQVVETLIEKGLEAAQQDFNNK
jgi:PTH1 family peptidyl-tRNA hydrolase